MYEQLEDIEILYWNTECEICKQELSYKDRVLRDKNYWFHSKCYLQRISNKCSFCEGEIFPSEKFKVQNRKIFHPKCYEKAKSKVEGLPISYAKRNHKKTPSYDPVLLLIATGIFSLLIVAAYMMFSPISMIAVAAGMILTFYHLIAAKRFVKAEANSKVPSSFAFSVIVLPFVFAILMAFDGYSLFTSIPKAIIVWGLSMTFWSNMMFIPISIWSRAQETSQNNFNYTPFITVLIPCYNEEKVVSKTIESILAIDYPNKEVIAIDDGSKDNTLKILQTYKSKIKILSKKNSGKASSLNYGVLYAKGDIIIAIDADTVLTPQSIRVLVQGFRNEQVGAVAGNIKVRNRKNWITWCQALEYVAGIQIFRRVLDYFNAIAIVPGALGAFRKSFLQSTGGFSLDNLAEDFDVTLKVLKSGKVVNGKIDSKAYTEAPDTIYQFYRQRKRWYRGDMQVLAKHKNILFNEKFGTAYNLTFPLMLISMFVTPFAGLLVWGVALIDILEGGWLFVVQMLLLFITLQHLQNALAVRIEGEDPKLIAFSTFFVIGYKQIIDAIMLKSAIETFLRRQAKWTTVKRQGIRSKK